MKQPYIKKQIEHFVKEAEKVYDIYSLGTTNMHFPIIYHYTNYSGLEGILKNKNLWLTDYRRLNDPLEIEYSNVLVKNEFHKHITSLSDIFVKEFFIESLNLYTRIIPENMNVYVCSFCKNPDYLPAWRWYSDNGAGFSIGFRFKINQPNNNFRESITRIIYGEKNSAEIIKKFLTLTNNYLNKITQKCRYIKDKAVLYDSISPRLISNLITLLPCLKHEAYFAEDEIRLYYQIINKKGNLIAGSLPNEKLFKRRKKLCSSRFVIPENKEIDTLIHDFEPEQLIEIYVGPRCSYVEACGEIKKILNKNGFNSDKIKIKKSGALYRG